MTEALAVYDHIIVNDDLEVATDHLLDILTGLTSDEQ
jgi:guanylate kinase